MRTLHIEMGRHRLGGTMQVFYLLRGLKELGIPSSLVCPLDSPLHRMAIQEGITVHGISFAGDHDLLFIPRLIRILKKDQPDIVHIHSRRGADTLGLVAAKLTGDAKVIISRRVDDPIRLNAFNRLRYVLLPDRVVTVSKGIARVLEEAGVPAEKIRQVYSAIDFRSYQSPLDVVMARRRLDLPPTAPVLAIIAQLIPRKGHRFLLEAMSTILSRHPGTRVLFVGEGAEELSLRDQVSQLGLTSAVHFLGYRNDIGDILRACDLLVHPATMEGFANVAMQAMAAGLPVVSSKVGGMPESVRDGVTGILVPPRDPVLLAEGIVRLLDDPAMRRQLGAQGKAIVEKEFNTDAMVKGNQAVYEELLRS